MQRITFLPFFLSNPVILAVMMAIWMPLVSQAQEYSPELAASATAGNAEAQFQVGMSYLHGKGVTLDKSEAFKWITDSAERNHLDAQVHLGGMYYTGIGVTKDVVMAWKWFSIAKASGHSRAGLALNLVEQGMTPDQISQAKSLTAAFKPLADKLSPQDEKLAAYRPLIGEDGAGSAFVIRYDNRLLGVASLHQFDNGTPAKLLDSKGAELALNPAKVIKQEDVQAVELADQKTKVTILDYNPVFKLTEGESLWVYDAEGKIHKAKLDLEFASKYLSSQGPMEIEATVPKPIVAAGASGSPVIQGATGQVIGVLLGANDATAATRLSFETLCLPDLTPPPPPPAAPVYADPKQAAAFASLTALAKKVPAAHWKATEAFFKAYKVPNTETLAEYLQKASATAVEVKPANAGWMGTISLVDKGAADLKWTYHLALTNDVWLLTKLCKIEDGETTDSFDGDPLMQRCWTTAVNDAAKQP